MLSRGGGALGRVRQLEGAVRGEAGAAVGEAVVALDQQHLVRRHEGRVVPALPRVMGEVIDLADPVREHLVGRDQVLGPHARGVGQRERRALDRAADRSPDVDLDDAGAGCGKAAGLGLAEQILHPLRAALLGVVDVHAACRAAQPVAVPGAGAGVGAPGGIEHDDAAGTGQRAQQRLDLRVVHALDRVIVVQVRDGGLVAPQLEALAIERERVRERPHVLDQDAMAFGLEQHPRRAAGQCGAVEHRLGVRSRDEGQRRPDVGRGQAASGGSDIKDGLGHGLASVGVAGGHGFHRQHDLGAAGGLRQRVRFTAP